MKEILPNLSLILSIIAFLGLIFALWQIRSLNHLRKIFFAGSQAIDLESVIHSLRNNLESGNKRQEDIEQDLAQLRKDFGFAVQKLGLVRFNPFEDGGGNFSFSLALLDAHDSGLIITSMHGRQQNRVYTKRLKAGKSETQLTEEELQPVQIANYQNKI